MAKCSKEVEIELSNGTVIDATIKVEGCRDPNFESWFVESWEVNCLQEETDGLTDKEISELKEKAEEIALSESWDFDTAENADEDEDLED